MPTVFFGRGQRTLVRGAARLRADARSLPCRDSAFSLVTCRSALYRLNDPHAALREMLRVCRPGGRLVIADLVRPNSGTLDRDNLERLRDPEHPPTPSIARVVELVTQAGGDIRELEVRTVECPVASWLGHAADTGTAQRIRAALVNEVDGGPRTGAKPRIIGGELWITQRWIHLAATPIRAHAASESVIMQ
jgi:SAM-dependent methyltransferase